MKNRWIIGKKEDTNELIENEVRSNNKDFLVLSKNRYIFPESTKLKEIRKGEGVITFLKGFLNEIPEKREDILISIVIDDYLYDEGIPSYLLELVNRSSKYNIVLTFICYNIKEILKNEFLKRILMNTDTVHLLKIDQYEYYKIVETTGFIFEFKKDEIIELNSAR